MNGKIIWSIVIIIVYVVMEVLFLKPKTMYGNSVSFLVSQGDSISIEGAETVSLVAENGAYFRIYAGNSHLLAIPDAKDQFSVQDPAFPAQDWQIKDGVRIKVTLSADHLLVVVKNKSIDEKMAFLILGFVFAFFVWGIGYSMLK